MQGYEVCNGREDISRTAPSISPQSKVRLAALLWCGKFGRALED
jgi:hypothetical protein